MNRLYFIAQRTICMQRSFQLVNIEPLLLRNVAVAAPLTNLRTFKLINNGQQKKSANTDEEKPTQANAQKKLKTSPKITLIGQNQSITVTSLEEAKKLAKRRDLHLQLVQELDTKTQRPVYKLVTPAELLAEELEDLKTDGKGGKIAAKKSEKTLTIGSRISEHDLASRQKNICKWLAKQHEVRILIQGSADDLSKMEKICQSIEKSIKEPEVIGKIQQKRTKGSHIKFNIVPVATEKTNVTTGATTTTAKQEPAPPAIPPIAA